jgi:hypothetical protein
MLFADYSHVIVVIAGYDRGGELGMFHVVDAVYGLQLSYCSLTTQNVMFALQHIFLILFC